MSFEEPCETASFDDLLKVDIRVGTIVAAERVPKSEKLLKLDVDLGHLGHRQVLAGIGKSYDPDQILGRRAAFVINLAPRMMMGLVSHGMILAAPDEFDEGKVVVPSFEDAKVGSRVG